MFYRIILFFTIFLSSSSLAEVHINIKSFEANFEQTVTNASSAKINYTGKVFIKEPSMILWQYKAPIIKNVYVIANVAVVDEPELEQAIYTRLENEVNLIKLLKNAQKKADNLYETVLNNIVYKIFIKNQTIVKIEYKDELDNQVTIGFSEIKQNHSIKNERFQFIPPEYYDVIKK